MVAITNANNDTVSFEYNAVGDKTAQVDAMGYRTEMAYDSSANLLCMIDANATAGGTKNAYGCSSRQFYDSLNRLTKSVDAMDGETTYTYDYAGNRLTVTDAEGKLTRNSFDDLGRLSSEADHANRSVFYKTDEAGNVYERTSRLNVVRRMNFDIANRLVRSFDASGANGFAVERG